MSIIVLLYNSILIFHQGAHNPDAEEAVTERYRNAKARLRDDLYDQLQTRLENLDEQHESLEYTREKAELCGLEAKVIMKLE